MQIKSKELVVAAAVAGTAVGIAAIGATVLLASPTSRELFKSGLRRVMVGYQKSRFAVAEAGELWGDLVAEARLQAQHELEAALASKLSADVLGEAISEPLHVQGAVDQ